MMLVGMLKSPFSHVFELFFYANLQCLNFMQIFKDRARPEIQPHFDM